jgi:hypothetical protein
MGERLQEGWLASHEPSDDCYSLAMVNVCELAPGLQRHLTQQNHHLPSAALVSIQIDPHIADGGIGGIARVEVVARGAGDVVRRVGRGLRAVLATLVQIMETKYSQHRPRGTCQQTRKCATATDSLWHDV